MNIFNYLVAHPNIYSAIGIGYGCMKAACIGTHMQRTAGSRCENDVGIRGIENTAVVVGTVFLWPGMLCYDAGKLGVIATEKFAYNQRNT